MAVWTKKDFLTIRDLSKEELELLLETADSFKEISLRPIKKVPALRGKTVVNFFFEPSTRTRASFELSAKRLSADILNISSPTSSVTKGESLKDTIRNLQALKADIIIIRHSDSGAPQLVANAFPDVSIINAGDGSHEHPTQALLDLYTLKEKKGKIEGLKVAIVGDITHSRVARSNIWGLTKLGAEVTVVGPRTLIPAGIEQMGVTVQTDFMSALREVDVVYMLRVQNERLMSNVFPSIREYARLYGLTKEKLSCAKEDIIVMHPGPINRGVEISSEVADGPQSVILDQVTNGLATRMAVLFLVSSIKKNKFADNDE
ncbi:MAG: aspartate carbamoyltransferase catalytic subunit [Candidatus Ancaeobacter aquaticus]|nr:aspartate carbamoyltransferase catalytic subunit [Candidatus Ancaeobacter aquaticus]